MSIARILLLTAAPLALCAQAQAAEPAAILDTYADIALAGYEDSLKTAQQLDAAIEALAADPTEGNLTAAREAWLAARVPYQQTEAFRFGNPIVDEWEGRVKAIARKVDTCTASQAREEAMQQEVKKKVEEMQEELKKEMEAMKEKMENYPSSTESTLENSMDKKRE